MSLPQYTKDPGAILDYGFDWTDWLSPGDYIAQSSWTVETGVTNLGENLAGAVATVQISGGDAGGNYLVTNRIATSQGRIDERSLRIMVENR